MTPAKVASLAAFVGLLATGAPAAHATDPVCVPIMSFDVDNEGWYLLRPDGTRDETLWRAGIGVDGSGGLLLPAGVSTIQLDAYLGYADEDEDEEPTSFCFSGRALDPADDDARAAVFWVDGSTATGCGGGCLSTRFPPRPPCQVPRADGFRIYLFSAPVNDVSDCDLEEFSSITVDHEGDFIVDSIGVIIDRDLVCLRQCDGDLDCDDADSCTTDVCQDGICDNRVEDGCCDEDADCFDGLACTSEVCAHGNCEYDANSHCCERDADCDDDDGCTVNRCDMQSHTCQAPEAVACGDNDACTADSCVDGTCVHDREVACCVAHADCDDRNPCTIDRCGEAGCSYAPAPVGTPCEYVDACSFGDVCDADHVCVAQWSLPCDDGELCNGVESCYAAACVPGTPVECEDGVTCTVDSCEPGFGCLYSPDELGCDDGIGCTIDHCDPVAGCRSTPSSALCNDGVGCTRDVCDPTGGCAYLPLAAACDDGVSCTVDSCDAALGCVSTPVDAACGDGDPCTVDRCGALGCTHTDNGSCASQCGDGVCSLGGETCATCPGDCGVCPDGDCCARRAGVGCSDAAVQACVCAADAYCCTVLWDDACAALVTELSCGVCENATVCGDAQCDAAEDCASCSADCGTCAPVCGDEVCQIGESCASCQSDCGACPSSCCIAQETAGCDAADVAACVCAADDYCCSERWDAACASAVELLGCGTCVAAGICGDGTCGGGEGCATCAMDCGACPPVCENGACEPGETCLSCATDCGACPPPEPCLAAVGVSCDVFDQAYVKASNTDASDNFGHAVAVAGEWLVVGAPGEDGAVNTASASGAAYVFRRVGGIWQQADLLRASNADAGDQFGYAVAVSEDRIVVGAPNEDSAGANPSDNSAANAGAAYVFEWSGVSWQQSAILKASNAGAGDSFGMAVAISGDTVAVGAPTEDSAGVAYVFVRDRYGWVQEARLLASNADAGDLFGNTLALEGDSLAVAAPHEASRAVADGGSPQDNQAQRAGAVYVFERGTGGWSEVAFLKAHNADAGDRFGFALALNGGVLAVGAPYESSASAAHPEDDSLSAAGAVYIFAAPDWVLADYVKANTVDAGDRFGQSLGLDWTTLVVGVPFEDGNSRGIGGDPTSNAATRSGAVAVYRRVGDVWQHRALLKSSNPDPSDYFGAAVAFHKGALVVGAYGEDSAATGVDGDQQDDTSSASGAVYVRKIAP